MLYPRAKRRYIRQGGHSTGTRDKDSYCPPNGLSHRYWLAASFLKRPGHASATETGSDVVKIKKTEA